MKRMVIKVGSNVLTRPDGFFDTTRVSALVDQIVALRRRGYEIILVSSGAVACGRSVTAAAGGLDEVQRRQLFASVGQVILMNHYYGLFADYGFKVGQVLTMKKNFETAEEYENQRRCMEGMLGSGLIPIVNENDTVSITELMFTDNDELSGLVATMMGAQTLFILSNVDGIYDGDPANPASSVIPLVRPDDSVEGFVSESRSEFGRGGMASKCHIAREAARSGIRVVIANGNRDHILLDVLERPETTIHTEFIAK